MFKKIIVGTLFVTLIGLLVFGAVNRTLANDSKEITGRGGYGQSTPVPSTDGQMGGGYPQGRGNGGNGRGQSMNTNGAGMLNNLPPADSTELSEEESAALIYMREEEKLAHDVYVTLYEKWNMPIFSNISQSESTHTDSIKTLLDRYGIQDPAAMEIGVFTNPELQTLYDELVKRGSQSLAEALKVGAAIEEIDILDLKSRLELTDNADIQQVFSSLARGSNNHLQAFVSTLNNQTGETYQPQYLSADEYQSIITSTVGRGNGQSNPQGGRGGRRGGRP